MIVVDYPPWGHLGGVGESENFYDKTQQAKRTSCRRQGAQPPSPREAEQSNNHEAAFNTLRLTLGQETDLVALSTTIGELGIAPSVVHTITVTESRFPPDWTGDVVNDLLFDALATLSHVKCLRLENLGRCDAGFPVRWLSQWLSGKPTSLEVIHVEKVHFMVYPRELEDLSLAIQQSRRLREFRWNQCGIWESTLQVCSLDSVFQALATVQTLKVVDFVAEEDGILGDIDLDSVRQLCQNPHLESLRLYNFVLDQDHANEIIKILQYHPSLQHVCLQCILTAANILNLAQVISCNRRLISLGIYARNKLSQDDDHCLGEVAHSLRSSPSLTSVAFSLPEQLSQSTKQAFCQMLENNYALQELQFIVPQDKNTTVNCPLLSRITFLLNLNRMGRQQLLQYSEHATTRQWMQVLGNGSNDLDFLFYFLRQNPSICVRGLYEDCVRMDDQNSERKRKRCN